MEKEKLKTLQEGAIEEFRNCSRKTCMNCSLNTMKWCVHVLSEALKQREKAIRDFQKIDLENMNAEEAKEHSEKIIKEWELVI